MVLTFESADEILSVTIQMKGTEQYYPVYEVVLPFESVDKIPKGEHSNGSFEALLFFSAVKYIRKRDLEICPALCLC